MSQIKNQLTDEELFVESHKALLGVGIESNIDALSVNRWNQTWSDTSCGFGGIAGQAFTDAETAIVRSEDTEAVVVFHANALAYVVENPTADFEKAVKEQNLVGLETFPYVKGDYDEGQTNENRGNFDI